MREVELWKIKFDELSKASIDNLCVSSNWFASENSCAFDNFYKSYISFGR